MPEPLHGFRSILLPVPEVERLVDPFRRAGDWSRERGVPAHMTIAGPWPLEVELPVDALAAVASELRGTRFELGSVGALGASLCLFPTDDATLLAWRRRALAAIGSPDRLDDAWRLHLTIRRDEPTSAETDTKRTVARSLPIACEVRAVLIAELDEAGRVSLRPL